MRRTSLILLLLLLFILPFSSARGQQDFTLEQLTVSFWPEYDQRAMLVIYQAQLPENTSLPTTVQLPLPAGVSSPHAVANTSDTGSLVNAQYQLVPAEWGQLIEVTAESSTVWVEYYRELEIEGETRSFDYQWPGTISAAEFVFEVQQPPGAVDLTIMPIPSGQRVGPEGLTYRTGSFGSIQSGEEAELELSYRNPGEQLTVGAQPETPLDAVSTTPPESASQVNWQTPALIALALAGLLGVGFFLWQRREKPAKPARSRRRQSTATPTQSKFCHQCGQQVKPQDKFCRHCGAEQRLS
ncbi:MAG: zinc ribbon domain-containing protein [Anaerolineales bacterium]